MVFAQSRLEAGIWVAFHDFRILIRPQGEHPSLASVSLNLNASCQLERTFGMHDLAAVAVLCGIKSPHRARRGVGIPGEASSCGGCKEVRETIQRFVS